MKSNKSRVIILQSCIFTALFALMILLNLNIRLTRDDFFYYTFARHGLSGFINLLREHYFNINGKLLVNGLCAIFLKFGAASPLFRIFNTVEIILLAALLSAFAREGKQRVWIFLAALALFLLMGNYIFAESVLWICGSCNYLFSSVLLAAYVYMLTRANGKAGFTAAAVLGTLTSLTTELFSIAALGITVFAAVEAYRNNRFKPVFPVCAVLIVCGFLFLLLSPGMHMRAESVNSPEMFATNLTVDISLFSQMIWERGGGAAIVIISALSNAVCAYKHSMKRIAAAMTAVAAAAALTFVGVVYSAVCYIIFNVAYFVILVIYAAGVYRQGERVIPICTAVLGLSFAFICAPGIVGVRMIFLPVVFVITIGLRSLACARLKQRNIAAVCALLAIAAVFRTGGMIQANFKNAAIWDQNQRVIENYSGGDIVFQDMYDESVFRGGVPVDGNFGAQYLAEFGIPADTVKRCAESRYYSVYDDLGKMITNSAVERRGTVYISLGDMAAYLGASLNWLYSAAEMTLGSETLRFREYTYSAMTARFGGLSKKLKYPVRNISDRLYISLYDANALFGLKLTAY